MNDLVSLCCCPQSHYNDVIVYYLDDNGWFSIIIVLLSPKSLQWRHCLLNRLLKAQIKENIKTPRHWPLCGEFTGDRWIPRTEGQ